MYSRLLAGLISVGAIGSAAAAEPDEGISTDRPDFVESAEVVGKGVFQIETSFAFERNTQQGTDNRTWTTPTLLRYGVSDTLELRLETDGFVRQHVPGSNGGTESQNGMADASIGLKWHLGDGNDKGVPGTAVLFHIDLDSGSAPFRRNGQAYSLRGVAEWDLPSDGSLGVMAGVVFDRDEAGQDFRSGILAITASKPLAEKLRGFVELAGRSLAEQRFGGNVVTFDTGLTYAVSKDMQWDIAAAVGLNKETPDYSATVGFSIRFR